MNNYTVLFGRSVVSNSDLFESIEKTIFTILLFIIFALFTSNTQAQWVNEGTPGFSAGVALNQSMAFNGSTPYVAYQDNENGGKTTVMKFDWTNWVNVGIVGFSAGRAVYQSLAFSGNTPYVAYRDDVYGGKTTVMKFDGTSWVNVGIAGFSEGSAHFQSLAFSGSTPYVAYEDQANADKTTVMKFDGTSWVNVGAPGFSEGKASHQSLAFSGTMPYVAFRDDGNGYKATVMKFDGTSWVNVGAPGFSAGEARYQSLAFIGSTPYVAFRDFVNGSKTTVMKFNGVTWVNVGTPGFSAGIVYDLCFAFSGNTPYVAYSDDVNGDKTTVMKFDGTNWVNVGAAGFSAGAAHYLSLAISGSTPYVAYSDIANGTRTTVMKFESPDAGISDAVIGSHGQVFSAGKGYNLTASVKNFGEANQNVIPVYYTLNGGSPVGPINTVGPINPDSSEVVVFSGGNAFIPVTGTNIIKIYSALGDDIDPDNDTLTITIEVLDKITTFPYTETFDQANGWTVLTTVPGGNADPWSLALCTNPDGEAGDRAALSDFRSGTNSFGRVSIFRTPEIDFSGMSYPVLDFYIAYRPYIFEGIDRIQVLVSTDGGLTFNPASTPYNKTWNTDPSLATLVESAIFYTPAAAGEWRHETVDLSNVGNNGNVVIGFVSTSDWGNNAWIDNVVVSQPNSLCTDNVTGPGIYNCNSLVSLNFTSTPVPPLNGNQPTAIDKTFHNKEKALIKSTKSVGSFPNFEGNATINSGNQTDNPNGGTVFISQYTNNNPSQNIALNNTATAPDASVYTPVNVYHDFWFTISYDGNDYQGYANYDISIDVTDAGFMQPEMLYIMKRTDNTGAWVCQNTTLAGNILTVTGLTDFSDFALAGLEVLPVELSSFVSSVSGNDVTLNWTTASEINNSGFDIERSSLNNNWTKISNVSGHGNSNSPNSYSYSDKNLASGNYSYRLKQIDFNGNFEYFNLSNEVVIGIPEKFELSQNYPNPFNPSTNINYALPTDGLVSIKIFDMTGKEVMSLVNEVKTAGYYSVNFNASNLSSGIYFYRLSSADFTATKKMMLVK